MKRLQGHAHCVRESDWRSLPLSPSLSPSSLPPLSLLVTRHCTFAHAFTLYRSICRLPTKRRRRRQSRRGFELFSRFPIFVLCSKCRVCPEPADGTHFGIDSCRFDCSFREAPFLWSLISFQAVVRWKVEKFIQDSPLRACAAFFRRCVMSSSRKVCRSGTDKCESISG